MKCNIGDIRLCNFGVYKGKLVEVVLRHNIHIPTLYTCRVLEDDKWIALYQHEMEERMKLVKINFYGKEESLFLSEERYAEGGYTAVVLLTMEGDMFAMVSANIPGMTQFLPKGVFYGKGWSENEGILEELVRIGAIEKQDQFPKACTGFVSEISAYKIKED